jgi:hypothetical protein
MPLGTDLSGTGSFQLEYKNMAALSSALRQCLDQYRKEKNKQREKKAYDA